MTHTTAHSLGRLALLLTMSMALSGCFNSSEAEMTLNLGSVSVGQQLMDLETARSAGLLSDSEARMIRDKLVQTIARFELDREDDDDEDDWKKDDEDDDGFTWF